VQPPSETEHGRQVAQDNDVRHTIRAPKYQRCRHHVAAKSRHFGSEDIDDRRAWRACITSTDHSSCEWRSASNANSTIVTTVLHDLGDSECRWNSVVARCTGIHCDASRARTRSDGAHGATGSRWCDEFTGAEHVQQHTN
jgi:hypothetical protein